MGRSIADLTGKPGAAAASEAVAVRLCRHGMPAMRNRHFLAPGLTCQHVCCGAGPTARV